MKTPQIYDPPFTAVTNWGGTVEVSDYDYWGSAPL
jgi:hypothetical protein